MGRKKKFGEESDFVSVRVPKSKRKEYKNAIKDFVEQQERDRIKSDLCKKNGITLIFVPYTLDYDEFQVYIIEEYRKLTGREVKNKQKYDWRTFKRENLDLSRFF